MSIYDDFPANHPIWSVSNPETVRDNYHRIYEELIKQIKQLTGVDSQIYKSSQKYKKYMVFNGKNMSHFGDIRYSDFTFTHDERKRELYGKRFNKPDNDPYKSYNLSLWLLW